MWALGTIGTIIFFFGFWLLPSLVPVWHIGMLYGPLLALIFWRILGSYDWKAPYERQIFGLVVGALTFFIFFAPLQELDASRTDNTAGMGLVGLAFLVGLILMGKRVWARSRPS